MVRRVTPSQFRSMVRQAEQKQRQAVDRVNREIRAYNQKVRAHDARVRANQQRLRSELTRLSQQTTTTRYVTFRASVRAVHTAYDRLDHAAETGTFDQQHNEVLDLSEREAANSVGLMNVLLGGAEATDGAAPNSPESPLTPRLQAVSSELADRWRGAVFSLNPHNPDAARHFCTSARELITRILDTKAPDDDVTSAMPDCKRTDRGNPTRREKIRYLLHRAGTDQSELEEFVDSDMNNIVDLFQVFNDGTHGSAGTFDFSQLRAIRNRVEDGITFLLRVVH